MVPDHLSHTMGQGPIGELNQVPLQKKSNSKFCLLFVTALREAVTNVKIFTELNFKFALSGVLKGRFILAQGE